MPLKIYRPKGNKIWYFYGTVAGHRLRGSTRTTDKSIAAQIAAKVELDAWKRDLHGDETVLTFPQAVAFYLAAGKGSTKREQGYLKRIVKHWGDTAVKDMSAGAIRQSAIDIHPKDTGATRNRQVITPTQAIINHCAELEKCSPIRVRRFQSERKIKKPVTVEWLDTFCAHARPLTAALATFMFATACRISEAKRLEWADIDFQQRSILITKTKTKRQRLPSMPQRLLVALANLPREKRPFYWSETELRRQWDQDVEKTAKAVKGFERLTFHSCRHGFATKLLRDGIDPKTVAELGDWSIGILMENYAHAIQDARLTDTIFDKPVTNSEAGPKKINSLDQ